MARSPLALALLALVLACPARGSEDPLQRLADYVPDTPRRRGLVLAEQFADADIRDQGPLGSCHAFAAVALLEAGYFRQHGRTIKLSEADLFLNAKVLGADYVLPDGGVSEGGWLDKNLEFAISHGIASSADYAAFVTAYESYRRGVSAESRDAARALDELPWYAKPFALLSPPSERYAAELNAPTHRENMQALLRGRDGALREQREAVRAAFAGFRPEYAPFPRRGSRRTLWCGDRRDRLLRELTARRPVAVSMDVAGLERWGTRGDARPAWHAFVVHGYDRDSDGRVTFRTRNSWNGWNPTLVEDDLCRIRELVVLRVPKDRD